MDGGQGNFGRRLLFPAGPDPRELARFMLSALFGGYGARKDTPIEVQAPLVMPFGILFPDPKSGKLVTIHDKSSEADFSRLISALQNGKRSLLEAYELVLRRYAP